jgi:hypothetical protein
MEFERIKKQLNKELDEFSSILHKVLPRYVELIRKTNISKKENTELGELEHYLIEVNGKIAEIKSRLDQILFGETIDVYYEMKEKALNGDPLAKIRFDMLRTVLSDSIKDETFFNWN